eukprot:4278794-Amphidinium_carterae.1
MTGTCTRKICTSWNAPGSVGASCILVSVVVLNPGPSALGATIPLCHTPARAMGRRSACQIGKTRTR